MNTNAPIIIDDINEISQITNLILTLKHIVETAPANSFVYQNRHKFTTQYDSDVVTSNVQKLKREIDSTTNIPAVWDGQFDISIFFKEMVVSAVLESTINAFHYGEEVNAIKEFDKLGLAEIKILDRLDDAIFLEENNIHEYRDNIVRIFYKAVEEMSTILESIDIIQANRNIELAGLMTSGIIIRIRKNEMRILEER